MKEKNIYQQSIPGYMYPMVLIILCAGFQFYKYLLQVYPSLITEQLMQEYHLSGAGLGNLAAAFYYTLMITQFFVGMLLDRFGTRWIATLALLFCSLGALFFSQSTSLLTAWLARALMGVGVAFSMVTYMKIAAIWFSPRYYALVSGFLATATMAGAVFGQLPLAYFFHQIGWRPTLEVVGIAGLVLTVLFGLLARDNQGHIHQQMHLPKVSMKDFNNVFRSKQNWILTIYGGLIFAPLSVFAGLWGNPFLQQAYHMTRLEASYMISLIFIGLGIGSPIIGYVSSRLDDKRQLMMVSAAIATIIMMCVIYATEMSNGLLACLLFTFGFSMGSYLIVFTIGKELNSIAITATVIAMINAGDAIFTAMAEPLIGMFLDLHWSGTIQHGVHQFSLHNYQLALSILPLSLLCAGVLLFWVKQPEKKPLFATNIKMA